MKSYFKLSLATLITLSVLSSCKKDDDDVAPDTNISQTIKGTITYDSKNFNIGNGLLENYGKNDSLETYDFDLNLYNGTLSYNQFEEDFQGIGDIFYLDFNTNSSTGLESGTYTVTSDEVSDEANKIVYASLFVSGENTFVDILSGSAVVTRSNDTYAIVFKGKTDSDKDIEFNYSGTPGKFVISE